MANNPKFEPLAGYKATGRFTKAEPFAAGNNTYGDWKGYSLSCDENGKTLEYAWFVGEGSTGLWKMFNSMPIVANATFVIEVSQARSSQGKAYNVFQITTADNTVYRSDVGGASLPEKQEDSPPENEAPHPAEEPVKTQDTVKPETMPEDKTVVELDTLCKRADLMDECLSKGKTIMYKYFGKKAPEEECPLDDAMVLLSETQQGFAKEIAISLFIGVTGELYQKQGFKR